MWVSSGSSEVTGGTEEQSASLFGVPLAEVTVPVSLSQSPLVAGPSGMSLFC